MDRFELSRKSLLQRAAFLAGTYAVSGILPSGLRAGDTLSPRPGRKYSTDHDLTEVKGDDPYAITVRAVELLGGMDRFVKKGDIVVVKPNIAWNRKPEYAANTNPRVVAALVKMARDAGARRVRVFDNPCNAIRMTYENSGIAAAARDAGAEVIYPADWKYRPGRFSSGSPMNEWPINSDAVECDCFINVPVAKDHRLTTLTLSMKNLMGVCGGQRGLMHRNINTSLVDLTRFIKPDLTVIDAYRILVKNGPSGGNLNDVRTPKTVTASSDPVLADAHAAGFFNIDPSRIEHVVMASRAGLGSMNMSAAGIRRESL